MRRFGFYAAPGIGGIPASGARVEGSLVLLRKLIDGDWDDDMLTLQPGERLAMSYDDGVVKAVPAG